MCFAILFLERNVLKLDCKHLGKSLRRRTRWQTQCIGKMNDCRASRHLKRKWREKGGKGKKEEDEVFGARWHDGHGSWGAGQSTVVGQDRPREHFYPTCMKPYQLPERQQRGRALDEPCWISAPQWVGRSARENVIVQQTSLCFPNVCCRRRTRPTCVIPSRRPVVRPKASSRVWQSKATDSCLSVCRLCAAFLIIYPTKLITFRASDRCQT